MHLRLIRHGLAYPDPGTEHTATSLKYTVKVSGGYPQHVSVGLAAYDRGPRTLFRVFAT